MPIPEQPSRRAFLDSLRAGAFIGAASKFASSASATVPGATAREEIRDFLNPYVLNRDTIDQFLDPSARVWARFHPQFGYLLRNSMMRDGVDGSYTLASYDDAGMRRQVNFPQDACRLNTYGDSFTQGHQVSDGETWQEVLAAHFCEPIRNYGIGGFGVYQAYRRLIEVEQTDLGAAFVVFNIWGDDHLRSINAWRWLTFPADVTHSMAGEMFHANPWDHARLDEHGELVERANPCPTPASLYQLCDADFVYETFGQDEIVHALAAIKSGHAIDAAPLEKMAEAAGFAGLDLSAPDATRQTVNKLYQCYAIGVGMQIMARLNEFLAARRKKLMVLLSHPAGSTWHHCAGKPKEDEHHVDWHPAKFRDFLKSQDIPFVDTVEKHVAEFQQFKIDAKAYVDRYYIGHYNPQGNHFFAFAVKNELVAWLDPKPPTYGPGEDAQIRFQGYLPS